MPVGQNAGGNLNIYLFEVGMITRDDNGGETVKVASIHPLLVAPRDVAYTDQSASPVMQTTGGSIMTTSGRNLRSVQLNGTFGVDSRGLAIYIGTGEVRHERFYNEVVRMSEALSSDDVNEAINDLTGTPFIRLLVAPYDPERTTFYINFYDFWYGRSFSAIIRSWQDSRHYDRGGASGLTHYQMTVEEVGPLVTGSLASTLIQALFAGLQLLNDISGVLESYTASAILDGLLAPFGILTSELAQLTQAFVGQIESVQGIMGGFFQQSAVAQAGLADFFTTADAIAALGKRGGEEANTLAPSGFDSSGGSVGWSDTEGEGSNFAVEASEAIEDLEDLADAAAFQKVAGVFFGQDRATYQSFISGQASGSTGPNIAGSTQYTVGPTDTEDTIAASFGIPFDDILDLNGLTPDEALLDGAVLTIPRKRQRGSQRIDGLPTFGSHVGKAAWGADLTVDLQAAGGDFVILKEEDVLVQGVEWLLAVFGDPVIELLDQAPPIIRTELLELRLKRMLTSDKRIASVDSLEVTVDGATASYQIGVNLSAINGGLIRTGGAAA
jgi:LysM repeat protein